MADKLDFNSPEELEACLQENSPEWAQALAARTALRVFPLVLSIADVSDEILSAPRKQNLILQAFRANYISWAARKYPAHDLSFAAAAAADTAADTAAATAMAFTGAITGAAAFATSAAATAADTAAATADTTAAAAAAAAAAITATTVDAALWAAIGEDTNVLASSESDPAAASGLIAMPLWIGELPESARYQTNSPEFARRAYDKFVILDWVLGNSWELITDWYAAILPNGRGRRPESLFGEKADIAIAMQPEEFWAVTDERSAERILDEIAEIANRTPRREFEREYDHSRFMIIRVASDNLWEEGNHYDFGRSRFLEYTSPRLKAEFESLSGEAVAKLLNMPVLFAYERGAEGAAKLGRLNGLSFDDRVIDITYEFDPYVPPVAFDRIEQVGRSLGIRSNAEYTRHHWSIKDGDLYAILADAGIISVANDSEPEEVVEVPPQEPAPIETGISDNRVVRIHTDHSPSRPDIESIHSILIAEAAFLSTRLERQAPDAAQSLSSINQELGANLDGMRIYGVGYWAGVLNQISARIDEAILDDAAGRFAGFLANLNMFLRHSTDWNTYIRTAQNAELSSIDGSEAQARTPQIIEALAEHEEIVSEDVFGPLAALNRALLDAPMYNPETAYGFYRSLANVLQAATELALTDGVSELKEFARDVGTDLRKKSVSWTAGAILIACGVALPQLAKALPSMFGFLNPVLRILGII